MSVVPFSLYIFLCIPLLILFFFSPLFPFSFLFFFILFSRLGGFDKHANCSRPTMTVLRLHGEDMPTLPALLRRPWEAHVAHLLGDAEPPRVVVLSGAVRNQYMKEDTLDPH